MSDWETLRGKWRSSPLNRWSLWHCASAKRYSRPCLKSHKETFRNFLDLIRLHVRIEPASGQTRAMGTLQLPLRDAGASRAVD